MSAAAAALLLRGGTIHPMIGPSLAQGALLARGGQITYVGPEADLDPAAARGARVVELDGRALLPGLCDCHMHLTLAAQQHAMLDLRGSGSVEEVRRRVSSRAQSEGPGEWIVGHGWEGRLLPRRRHLSPAKLDHAAQRRPVFLISKDWHSAWLNSEGMRRLEALPRLPGKCRVLRLDSGEPALVVEDVIRLRDELIPPLSGAQKRAYLGTLTRELWARGITTVHTHEAPGDLAVLGEVLGGQGPRVRVLCNLLFESAEQVSERGELFRTSTPGWLAVGAIKVFLDGTFGTLSAAISEPYTGGGGRGELLMDRAELARWLDAAQAAGAPVAAHAIGDRAVALFLESISSRQWAAGTHHRVEHAQLLSPRIVERMSLAGVTFSVQPSRMWDDRGIVQRHLPERLGSRWAYPLRTMLDAGALLLFGSDAPVEDPAPWRGVQAAVTRLARGDTPPWIPGERLTLAQALEAHTVNPARLHGSALGGGILAPGQPADLVVLSRDPLTLSREQTQELEARVQVEMTFLDGEQVYCASSHSQR